MIKHDENMTKHDRKHGKKPKKKNMTQHDKKHDKI